ncbi:MAG: HYR domain-containing protein, partial [Winogradskyella sp.]|nr:HYR domain-containing protein [Winogradskyella sp.]
MEKQYTTKTSNKNYTRTLLFSAFLLIITVLNSYSQVRVPFAPRTASASPSTTIYTVKGDFTMVGNTNLTLQNYTTTANNNADMVYVDIDGDPNTWNSSSATITFSEENDAIPECSNIIYAGLYWTGRAGADEIFTVTNGTETKEFDKRKVQLKKAGGVYQDVIATTTIVPNNNIYFPSGLDGDMYSAYAEVTDYVTANGIGEYFVADIATLEGNGGNIGYYGGWGMVVVYENSKMNWRDVTVFDGHAYVQREGGVTNYTFDIDGFKTAENGYINIKLGVMAGEGDVGVPGDTFGILNRTTNLYESLSHSGNTVTNFFNSSINTGLNPRNPTLVNNTGVDIAMFDIDNGSNVVTDPDYNKYITNEQTSTSFQYGTSQDTYVIFNVTFSVDAYIPETEIIVANTSTNTSLDPGESADFTIEIKNTGTEATTNTTLNIPIPLSVDPTNLTFTGTVNPVYAPLDNYSAPTLTPPVPNVNNGSIVWNMGTLPLPNNPDDVIAELTFSYTVTTDCSILTDPDFDEFVTLLGTISGTGETSGTDFEFNLIQGYETDGLCIGDPIIAPIEIPINVTDYVNEAPTITAPPTLNTNGCDENDITASSARYPFSATESGDIKDSYEDVTGYTASDNGTIVSITYIDEIVSNTSCPLEITRIFTATDDCGKTATAEQIISVVDTTPPSITAPADVTIECTADESSAANGVATGSDTCGAVTITESDVVVDACGNTKTITRTWTATDECGNATSADQTITVQDTTGPEISCPSNATVTAPSGQSNAYVNIAIPTVSDSCGSVTFSNDYTLTEDASGTYDIGTTSVTYTAIDDCGNQSTCSFTVTVNDEEAPEINCPPTITVSCIVPDAYANYVEFVAAGGSATDNDGGIDGINPASFELTSEVSDNNTCPEKIIRVYSISDIHGNTASCSQEIIVHDEITPTIVVPSDATVECTSDTSSATTGVATASDNCSSVTITESDVVLDACGNTKTITRTWTATDECGNATSADQTITVVDTTPPSITAPTDVTIECTADESSAANGVATGSDTCGAVTITESDVVVDACGNTKTITRTWTATDECGNATSADQTITVVDTTPPSIDTDASNSTVECDGSGNTTELNAWLTSNGGAVASDTCGTITWSNNYSALSDDC